MYRIAALTLEKFDCSLYLSLFCEKAKRDKYRRTYEKNYGNYYCRTPRAAYGGLFRKTGSRKCGSGKLKKYGFILASA